MNAPVKLMDAQAALGFVVSQRTHIETQVLQTPTPEVMYPRLVPVDTSAPAYAPSVTFFTQDLIGKAKFINGKGDDIPLANSMRAKFEQMINMGGIGYSFSLEELGAAQLMGQSLSADGAMAARMASDFTIDELAFIGNEQLGVEGLFNTTGITSVAASNTFANLTPAAILTLINTQMGAMMAATNGIDMPDTLIVPIAAFAALSRPRSDNSDTTVLSYIKTNNVLTAQTGRPLTVLASWRLTDTAVLYKRDPLVLKMHMPMPLQFVAPQARNLEIYVPGMFRVAPVSIRRPSAVRYLTGVA